MPSQPSRRWLRLLATLALLLLGYTTFHRILGRHTSPTDSKSLPSSLLKPSLEPLASRLTAWRSRPNLDHDQAIKQNRDRCPPRVADGLFHPETRLQRDRLWKSIGAAEIVKRRWGVIQWLAEQVERGEQLIQPEGEGSRGIVMTGGNGDTALRLLSVLRHLRRLGNTLPIEVFHFSGELEDEEQRRDIEDLGAKIVQVRGVDKNDGDWKSFQIKGAALIQSSFTELVYLDSDNIPLRPVDELFEAPRYVNGGQAAFWPDVTKDHPNNAIWRLVGVPCDLDEWTFESGQIVIDKAGNGGLNLAALWIALAMQVGRDFWFDMCGGDKDTFRWAFRILDIPYTPAPRWVSALGFVEDERFCGHTMLQYDLLTSPQPMFVHSNLLKHLEGGKPQGPLFTHVKRMSLDGYDEPSLHYALMFPGSDGRRTCLRLGMQPTAEEDLNEEQRAAQTVLLTHVDDLEGRPFDGFEDAFFEEGGRIGGW